MNCAYGRYGQLPMVADPGPLTVATTYDPGAVVMVDEGPTEPTYDPGTVVMVDEGPTYTPHSFTLEDAVPAEDIPGTVVYESDTGETVDETVDEVVDETVAGTETVEYVDTATPAWWQNVTEMLPYVERPQYAELTAQRRAQMQQMQQAQGPNWVTIALGAGAVLLLGLLAGSFLFRRRPAAVPAAAPVAAMPMIL